MEVIVDEIEVVSGCCVRGGCVVGGGDLSVVTGDVGGIVWKVGVLGVG